MIPTIAQQLASLRSTMADTIMPALDPDNGFAQEQAGLVLATLDWLADVHAHAYRYEAAENADYRALLAELGPEDDEVRTALARPAPPAAAVLVPQPEVSAQNVAMKELAERLAGADPAAARPLLLALSARQSAREAAWFRMTGFPKEAGDLETLLTG